MDVKEAAQFVCRMTLGALCLGAAAGAFGQNPGSVQGSGQNYGATQGFGFVQNPTSTANPFHGSVTVHTISDEPIRPSLDDSIRRGFENNLGLKEAEAGEKLFQGEKNIALQEFLPTINLSGGTGYFEHNLAAQGFGPSTLKKFGSVFPGGLPTGISLITKDDLTQGQLSFHQTLFSGRILAR